MPEIRYSTPPCLYELTGRCDRPADVWLQVNDQFMFACNQHTHELAALLDRGYGVQAVRVTPAKATLFTRFARRCQVAGSAWRHTVARAIYALPWM